MIRQNQRFLTQLYVLMDSICMLVIFFVVYWIKFYSDWLPHAFSLPLENYLLWGTVYSFVAILVGFYVGFYSPKRRNRFSSDIYKILQVHALSFLSLLSMLYVTKEVHISREFLVLFFVINTMSLIFYRFMVKIFLFRLRRKGFNKKYVLILGAGSVGRRFSDSLRNHPELGYDVFGFLDDNQREHSPQYKHLMPIVGQIEELESVLKNHLIDEVIIALPLEAHSKFSRIINQCDNAGVKTLIIPDFFDLLPARPFIDNFAGIPLINVRDIPLEEFSNRLIKRTFDIVFSIFAILITSPIMLLAIIGTQLTSPGPIIFKQERVGLNRQTFRMYKFRTMVVMDKQISDTSWTVENDERRTKFGAFLRRSSIDELPQFFNVLVGHMSVVGPRPERSYFVEQFKDDVPKYMVKHHIRPGITGWAQSNGLRGDTSIQDRIIHDLFYIENWSFFFDLRIIIRTIVKGFVNRNAY